MGILDDDHVARIKGNSPVNFTIDNTKPFCYRFARLGKLHWLLTTNNRRINLWLNKPLKSSY
jgi:hypothetical protein